MLWPGLAGAEPVAAEVTAGPGDIIVTAQRRAENLQQVPIALSVASGATLAALQVNSISDIQTINAGTDFQLGNFPAASANILVRGLGTAGQSRSFEGSVGVFIDGVYRSRAAAALQNFLDIDSLQILRGPQTGLFGKNTTAGALLLTSVAPSTQDPAGHVELGLGNFGAILARAAANLPLDEHVAIRIAGLTSVSDSFFRNPATGQRYGGDSAVAVKGQILWQPAGHVSLRLIGDHSRTDSHCCYLSNDLVDGPDEPIVRALTLAIGGVPPVPGRLSFERSITTEGEGRIEDSGATLLADIDLAGGQLQSITSYRRFVVDQQDMDGDLSGADIERYAERLHSRQFSQELIYRTMIRPWAADLLLGGYFADEKLNMGQGLFWGAQAQQYWDLSLGLPGLVHAPEGQWSDAVMGGKARSWSAFAHLDMKLTAKLGLVLGGRYSIERKSGHFHHLSYAPEANDVLRLFGVMPGPAYAASRTDRAFSGTLGLQLRPAEGLMLYVSLDRGFKAGGINIDGNAAGGVAHNPAETTGATALDPSYRPERITAFEVGLKADYLNGRARSSAAAFVYDLSDVQIAQFQGLQFKVLNARSASVIGIETEHLFEIRPGISLHLDGIWLPRARYGDDPQLDTVLRRARFRYAPEFQGNADISINRPISSSVNLLARLQYQFSSSQYVNTASATRRGSLGLWHANFGLSFPERNWRIEAWGRNIGNSIHITQSFNTPVQADDENAYLGAPRSFGLRLAADF